MANKWRELRQQSDADVKTTNHAIPEAEVESLKQAEGRTDGGTNGQTKRHTDLCKITSKK